MDNEHLVLKQKQQSLLSEDSAEQKQLLALQEEKDPFESRKKRTQRYTPPHIRRIQTGIQSLIKRRAYQS
jgi:hypothetical protein